MKKILALLLMICMVFSLVACTETSSGSKDADGATNVSADDTADEGSLTIVETSSGYYATVTHPIISSGYLANDGAIIVNFHFDEQEGWPYFFTINQNFAANFRDEANDEWIAVEHAIVGGNITFMWENLPFNVEDMDYASVIITQNPTEPDYYAEFDIEDILIFDDNYKLPENINQEIPLETSALNFVQSFAEGEDTEHLQTLIDEFNTIDPDNQVNLVTVAEDEMLDYLLDENNKADIFTVNSYHTADLYNADKLASLDEFMEQAIEDDGFYGRGQDINNLEYVITEYNKDLFTEIDGSVYSVPLFADSSILFLNMHAGGGEGIAHIVLNVGDDEPVDSGVLNATRWGTNPEFDYYGMSLLLTNDEPVKSAVDTIIPILYGYNGTLLQGDTFSIDNPEMLQTLQFIDTLGENGYLPPDTTQKSEEEVLQSYMDEITIMLIASLENGDIINKTKSFVPDEFYLEAYGASLFGTNKLVDDSTNLAISEQCEDKDTAFEFIKYLTYSAKGEFIDELGKATGTAYSNDELTSSRYQIEFLDPRYEFEFVDELKLLPRAEECFAELTKAGVAVLDGEKTPEQALADCQAEWDRILGQ